MSKRAPTPAPLESIPLQTIDLTALDAVTGGRISRSAGPDPQVLAGIQQLGQLIAQVGQSLTQAKAAGSQEMMQMMQQMMQARGR